MNLLNHLGVVAAFVAALLAGIDESTASTYEYRVTAPLSPSIISTASTTVPDSVAVKTAQRLLLKQAANELEIARNILGVCLEFHDDSSIANYARQLGAVLHRRSLDSVDVASPDVLQTLIYDLLSVRNSLEGGIATFPGWIQVFQAIHPDYEGLISPPSRFVRRVDTPILQDAEEFAAIDFGYEIVD